MRKDRQVKRRKRFLHNSWKKYSHHSTILAEQRCPAGAFSLCQRGPLLEPASCSSLHTTPPLWQCHFSRNVSVGGLCAGSDLSAVHTETSCWMFETSVLFVLRQTTHIKHLFSVFSWKVCYKHLWQLDLVKLVPPATQGSCPHTAVETPSQNPWQPPHPTAMAVLHFGLLMSSNVLCLNVFFLQFVLHTTFLLKLAKMKLCVVLCYYCISLEGKYDLLW